MQVEFYAGYWQNPHYARHLGNWLKKQTVTAFLFVLHILKNGGILGSDGTKMAHFHM